MVPLVGVVRVGDCIPIRLELVLREGDLWIEEGSIAIISWSAVLGIVGVGKTMIL